MADNTTLKRQVQLPDGDCGQVAIEGRCALRGGHGNTNRSQSWRLIWDMTGEGHYKWAELTSDMTNHIDGVDSPVLVLLTGETTGGKETAIHRTELKSGINTDGGFNSILMEWAGGQTCIFAGDRDMKLICRIPHTAAPRGRCGITGPDNMETEDLMIDWRPLKSSALMTGLSADSIMTIATEQPGKPTGIWEFLDRENDPARARPGGRYTLAVIESGETGLYHIIYMDGAQVNAAAWLPGMLKGTLRATPFERHYKLTWYDAMMEPIEHDIHADMPNRALLSVNFPLMQTVMRFSRRQ